MPGDGPTTAATSFLSIRNYIETTYGTGSFRAVREVIAARFPDFPPVLVPSARYRTPALFAILDAAHDLFGPADFYERCGRAIVRYEVNVFLRFALRLSTPSWVLERATDAWRAVHSSGRWEVTGTPGEVNARLVEFETTAGYCRMLSGYFETLLGLSGVAELTIEHRTCRGRGEASCLFIARWADRR
jgi:hypothetical protein